MNCIFMSMNLSADVLQWGRCHLFFRHFLVWSHIFENLDVHWKPLSTPVSWQQAGVAMDQSSPAGAPWSAVGRRKPAEKRESEQAKKSEQASPLRPGEWSTGRVSETRAHRVCRNQRDQA